MTASAKSSTSYLYVVNLGADNLGADFPIRYVNYLDFILTQHYKISVNPLPPSFFLSLLYPSSLTPTDDI